MKKLYALIFIVTGSVTVVSCSSQDNGSSNDLIGRSSTIIWQTCTDIPELQCATLEVPSDSGNSQSGNISLELNRLPSIQNERDGIVLINPGGPGGSGIEFLEELSSNEALPIALREKFDFIGFDPRGVGGSTPVDCSEFGTTGINEYLPTDESIDQYVEDLSAAAIACEKRYGAYIQQLSSINVVHDMDAIRKAAAEEKIHYLGYSYGTRLGALYLQTYPENSGHFILDASMKPESEVELLVAGAVEGMQANLSATLAACSSLNPDCNGEQLMDKLESKITTFVAEGREDELEIVIVLLYFAAENPALSPFLLQPLYEYLLTDDISELRQIYLDALSDLVDDADDTAERAVMCADDAIRPTANDLKTLLADYNQVSDIFAEVHISQAGMCSGWPESLTELPLIATKQAPASLVIGGTTDTLTLARWAEEMAQSITGYYLESNHLGHTVAFTGKNTCVDAIVEEFLLNGRKPLESICSAE